MTDFWRQARDARSAAPTRAGFRIAGTASDDGGFMFVAGELLATDEAVALLPEFTGPELVDITVPEEGIDQVGLRLFSYSGPVPLLDKVQQLQSDARDAAVVVGEDPDRCEVDLHHVVSGEPFIFRGGPADAPRAAGAPWQEPHAWGLGGPVAAVLDTGVPIEAPLGLWHHIDTDRDLDVDLCFPPGEAGPNFGAEAGHGAFILGLFVRFGVGTARLASRKVLDPDGFGTERMVVGGLMRLLESQPAVQVINLSLGAYTWHDRMPLGVGRALAAWPSRTAVVAAAGNNGLKNRPYWPAAADSVIGVASVRPTGLGWAPSEFSNSGPWVDVCTDGEEIVSLYGFGPFPTSATTVDDIDGWAVWSGTSFAAPIVAAEIARRVVDRGLDGQDAWQSLREELQPAALSGPGLEGFGLHYDPRPGTGVEPTSP